MLNGLGLLALFGAVPLAAWAVVSTGTLRVWVVVLSTVPILRITVAGAPLYAIDLLAGLAIVGLLARRTVRPAWRDLPARLRLLLICYLGSLSVPLVVQVVSTPYAAEALYGFGRELAALAALPIGLVVGRSERRTQRMLGWLVAGATATAVVAIAQRTPGLAPSVNDALQVLSPGLASGAARTYPGRSVAFMAAPTALSGFLCLVLLLVVFGWLRRHPWMQGLVVLVVAGGLLSTYSRQWLPAFLVGLAVAGRLGTRRAGKRSRRLLSGGLALTVVLFTVGPLDLDYLVDRVTATGSDDANVATRLERQRAFIGNVVAEPLTFMAGEGFALQDIGLRQSLAGEQLWGLEVRQGYTDNSFLLEFANRGVLAGLLYLGILGASIRRAVRVRRVATVPPELVAFSAALCAAAVLHLFDNYFSEAIFMRMTLWLLIGLTNGCVSRTRAATPAEPAGPHPVVLRRERGPAR